MLRRASTQEYGNTGIPFLYEQEKLLIDNEKSFILQTQNYSYATICPALCFELFRWNILTFFTKKLKQFKYSTICVAAFGIKTFNDVIVANQTARAYW